MILLVPLITEILMCCEVISSFVIIAILVVQVCSVVLKSFVNCFLHIYLLFFCLYKIASKYLNTWHTLIFFDFDHSSSGRHSASVVQIFVQIRPPRVELCRHMHFARWRPRHYKLTSGFEFCEITH